MIVVVCDTGPLTHLWQIDLWSAFQAFDAIHLTEQVVSEIEQYVTLSQLKNLAQCTLTIHPIIQTQIESVRASLAPSFTLETADLATLVLARKLSPNLVLTDDLTFRRVLEIQNHKPMGSVGLLVYAYKKELLNQQQLSQAIDKLFVHSTLYLSPQFKAYVRKLIKAAIAEELG